MCSVKRLVRQCADSRHWRAGNDSQSMEGGWSVGDRDWQRAELLVKSDRALEEFDRMVAKDASVNQAVEELQAAGSIPAPMLPSQMGEAWQRYDAQIGGKGRVDSVSWEAQVFPVEQWPERDDSFFTCEATWVWPRLECAEAQRLSRGQFERWLRVRGVSAAELVGCSSRSELIQCAKRHCLNVQSGKAPLPS
eukprot:TRINITY_DN23395_c0_g1_i1.p1 TRINITY_DN23395_c0_g1~~TRINITY_DN23395_c0_g1_i1.p1  ORF type:complete len:193 (-),score=31.03 TRINITY_DN23395_c0_g1_i1:188-766(-)